MPIKPPLSAHHPASPRPGEARQVHCPRCRHGFALSRRAVTVTCPRCTQPLAFDDLVLRSDVEGSVTTMGRLTLAAGSRTRATLTCGTLESAGRLEGRVLSYGPITLTRRSVTVGELTGRSLSVEAGARCEGRVLITAQPQPYEAMQPRSLAIPAIEPTRRRHGLTALLPRR